MIKKTAQAVLRAVMGIGKMDRFLRPLHVPEAEGRTFEVAQELLEPRWPPRGGIASTRWISPEAV